MEVDELIEQLQRNDPEEDWYTNLNFDEFRNQNQVDTVAQALPGFTVGEFVFDFRQEDDRDDIIPNDLNWDPLLREFETHENLETIEIKGIPTRRLLPLFRDQFFQSLQRNPNIRKLTLDEINFLSNDQADGLVSFLDGSPSLTDLAFQACIAGSRDVARNIAAALQRNNRIQTLEFARGNNANLLCAIYESLAAAPFSNGVSSKLRKISHCSLISSEGERVAVGRWNPPGTLSQDLASVSEALEQYLESRSATIECLELRDFYFDRRLTGRWPLTRILRGVNQNTTINELSLKGCRASGRDRDRAYAHVVRRLSGVVRDGHNLSTLRVLDCDFLVFPEFSNAVLETLGRRDSPWRCLDLSIKEALIPGEVVRSLLTAISNNTRLERLRLDWGIWHPGTLLVNALPSFKVRELTLVFSWDFSRERPILEALKRNYTAQSIHCKIFPEEENWFNGAEQARLDFYLNRNRKLAEWTENPLMVPRELYSYAMMLALKAGINPLFQSLVSLSGQGIGLRQQGQKRKRPQCHDPSP